MEKSNLWTQGQQEPKKHRETISRIITTSGKWWEQIEDKDCSFLVEKRGVESNERWQARVRSDGQLFLVPVSPYYMKMALVEDPSKYVIAREEWWPLGEKIVRKRGKRRFEAVFKGFRGGMAIIECDSKERGLPISELVTYRPLNP
jgi:hypothetical protein